MTDTFDIEPIIEDFLDDGRDHFSDRSIDTVLATVDRTSQRRPLGARLRAASLARPGRPVMALLPVGLLAIVLGGLVVATGRPAPVDEHPSTASLAPASPAAVVPSPAMLGVTPASGLSASGMIVFAVETGDGPALMQIRPDGTGLEEITSGGTCCAVLAPSGSDNVPGGATVMFEVDRDGAESPQRYAWRAGLPAFRSVAPGGFTETWNAQNIVDAGGPPATRLLPGAWTGADFAMQGISDEDPRRNGIYLSLANGGGMIIGEIVRMTGAPDGALDIPIAFSPDGNQLLFIRDSGIKSQMGRFGDLYVIDRGALSTSGAKGRGVYRPGAMRQLNPTGTLVLVSEAFGPGASWSPDGTRVAFSAFPRQGDSFDPAARVFIANATSGTATSITEPSVDMTSAHWSPDGAWIAYDVSDTGTTRDVWVVHPDGTGARRLTTFAAGSCCAVWSPDSSLLLAQGSDGTGDGLFIIAADGSGSTRLLGVDSAYDLRMYSWGAASTSP